MRVYSGTAFDGRIYEYVGFSPECRGNYGSEGAPSVCDGDSGSAFLAEARRQMKGTAVFS